jgi:NAD(P)-dependent dehydrogenase (short-subunit alcohol dehydrogenase family)
MSKRVLITGAASGIGAATAKELRSRGARVVGIDLRPGDDPELIACDVTDQAAVDSAVAQAIQRLGGLDVLINNAGIGEGQSAGRAPDETALAILDVNLIAPWRVTSAALPALREARGRVVNVASGLALMALPLVPAYCMSKRGLTAYSDALRLENADALTVTTVYPGYIKTPIHDVAEADGFALEGIVPEEDLGAVARTMARAALGRPVRDLAATRRGGFQYFLLRGTPRGLMDRLTLSVLRRAAKRGRFKRSTLARELVQRLS